MVSRMLFKCSRTPSPQLLRRYYNEGLGKSAVSGSARRLLAPLKPAARSSRIPFNGSRPLRCCAGKAALWGGWGGLGAGRVGQAGARAPASAVLVLVSVLVLLALLAPLLLDCSGGSGCCCSPNCWRCCWGRRQPCLTLP